MKMTNVSIFACAGVVMTFSSVLTAQVFEGDAEVMAEPMRFDGHQVVRVEIRTAVDLQMMRAISSDVWSEGVGMGPVDYRVAPGKMGLLENSGMAFEVLIEDVQVLIDAERGGGNGDGGWYTEFHPLAEVVAHMDGLAAAYPHLASVSTFGTTLEGRPMRVLSITGAGGPNRPTIVIEGNQHAREWITPAGTMFVAEELLSKYGVDPDVTALVNGLNIYVITNVNPDGYVYSWDHNRMWRKNRRDNLDGEWGVDLNRNWSTGWGGEGSSGKTDSQIYRGTEPFSEPETTAMRDFLAGLPRVDAFIDYHAYGQLVLQPWGYTIDLPPDHAELDAVGGMMHDAAESLYGSDYKHGPAYTTIYPASGIAGDYPYDAHGSLTYTIEMRDKGHFGFILPEDQIIAASEEGFAAFKELAGYINQSCIDLAVDNLVAGEKATFTVSNADAGATVAVLWSADLGSYAYEAGGWCLDFGLNIPHNKPLARLVSWGVANGNGVYANDRLIPLGGHGMTLNFQAGVKDTCPDVCMSNVVSETVQ